MTLRDTGKRVRRPLAVVGSPRRKHQLSMLVRGFSAARNRARRDLPPTPRRCCATPDVEEHLQRACQVVNLCLVEPADDVEQPGFGGAQLRLAVADGLSEQHVDAHIQNRGEAAEQLDRNVESSTLDPGDRFCSHGDSLGQILLRHAATNP